MKKQLETIKTLSEALPYIRDFYDKTIVVKLGGSTMVDKSLLEGFARDIVLMKYVGMNPVVVHGGGPQIGELLTKLGKKSEFIEGIRVTDEETMDVVQMVLAGKINTEIVGLINHMGGKAVGLAGRDGSLIKAEPFKIKGKDMGKVATVKEINPHIIHSLDMNDFIPVIAPLGGDDKGHTYNINADLVASAIASSLKAEKLILLTDVQGVLDKKKKLMSKMTVTDVNKNIKSKVIEGGMIPKVTCCLNALKNGVHSTHIIDGRLEHAVLLEVFTDEGIGTVIKKKVSKK